MPEFPYKRSLKDRNCKINSLFCRSSEDDYCPKSQVESIQVSLLEVLRRLYGEVDVNHEYATDANDIGQ